MPIAAPHPPIHIWTRRLGLRAVVSNLSAQAQDRFLWVPIFLATALQHILRCPLNLTRARASPFLQRGCAAQPLVFGRVAGLRGSLSGFHFSYWGCPLGHGEAALTDALSACGAANVVILATRLNPSDSPGPCLFFDARDMAREGAVALHLPQGGIGPITIETSRASQGARLWSGRSR